WVPLTAQQGLEHGPARLAENIRSHRPQLGVGVLQRLVDAIGNTRLLGGQVRPVAGQVPQLALRAWRDKTAPQQTVLQKLGNPLAVSDVAFAAGHLLQLARIHQPQLKNPFPQVPYRLPQDSSRSHGDVGHAPRSQPLRHPQPIPGHGPKGPDLFADMTLGFHAANGYPDDLLMNINPSDAAINRLHGSSSEGVATRGYRR